MTNILRAQTSSVFLGDILIYLEKKKIDVRIPFYSRSCSLEGLQEGDCNRNPRLRVPQEVLVDAACTGQKPSLLAGPNLTGENMAAITQFFFRAVIAHHHDHGTHPHC